MVARITVRYQTTSFRLVLGLVAFVIVSLMYLQDDDMLLPKQFVQVTTRPTTSSYNWAKHPQKYLTREGKMSRLPTGKPLALPKVQHDFEAERSRDLKRARPLSVFSSPQNFERQQAIKNAFKKTWTSYKRHAWGYDELKPISLDGVDKFNGWGATIVDSLDTLWMMGMYDEFNDAVEFVAALDWNNSTQLHCNLFETNIRYLGGLIAAFDLSQERVLLEKAIELGDMLYAAFDTPDRFPPFIFSFENLRAGRIIPDAFQSAAAIGSLSLEFTRLAQLTSDNKYFDAIDRIKRAFAGIQNSTLLPGLWPNVVSLRDGFQAPNNVFRLGADGDSLYEYLPKMYALLGGRDPVYADMYAHAASTTRDHLLFRPMTPDSDDILLLGSAIVDQLTSTVAHVAEMEHLTCFAGGMFALAGRLFERPDDVDVGAKLARGCAWAYASTDSGVMPEKSQMLRCPGLEPCAWDKERWLSLSDTATLTAMAAGGGDGDGDTATERPAPRGHWRVDDPRYLLRPEAVESLFVLYRITGEAELQDMAWDMWRAIDKATATDGAFAALRDVTAEAPEQVDEMESFFLAETLKYFYLIFSDPTFMSLDDWVFNTEAHPFKRPGTAWV
ncbi:hypothetical protein BN1708_005471, partial [Verticillium longisporum]